MSPVSPESPANLPGGASVPDPTRSNGGAVSVGIVLVSHSRALAEAALDLAHRLIVAVDVSVDLAAGLADGGLGTDPGAVVEAVERLAERCEGVLVLADLGSGIMSAEMALEMLEPALAERTRLSAAPSSKGCSAPTAPPGSVRIFRPWPLRPTVPPRPSAPRWPPSDARRCVRGHLVGSRAVGEALQEGGVPADDEHVLG